MKPKAHIIPPFFSLFVLTRVGDGVEGGVVVMSRGGVGNRGCAGALGGRRARSATVRHRYAVHPALQQV